MSDSTMKHASKSSLALLKVQADRFKFSRYVLLPLASASYGISAKLANSEPFETALHVLEALGDPCALGRRVVVPAAQACFWIAAQVNAFGDACTDRIRSKVGLAYVDEVLQRSASTL